MTEPAQAAVHVIQVLLQWNASPCPCNNLY